MVIYRIMNKTTGKCNVGQTIQKDPLKRWRYHRWSLNNNKHVNCHLQHAWNKYGQNDFIFEIIEDNIKTISQLNLAETKWIDYYQSKGLAYNMNRGGDNALMNSKTKKKQQKSLREHYGKFPIKEWGTVISPTGEEIEIVSMGEFCRIHGVRRDRMKSLFRGKIMQHRGWKLKFPIKTERKRGYTFTKKWSKKGKTYRVINGKTNETYTGIKTLKSFAKEHGVSVNTLYNSLYNPGRIKSWKVSYEEIMH